MGDRAHPGTDKELSADQRAGVASAGLRRVCYFGTYRAEYARNQVMIAGLRRAGLEVVECHAPLWHGIADRVAAASGGWARPGFLWRALGAYARLLWRYRQAGRYDVMVIGYPGLVDVYLARLLTWLAGRPLVWDVFMSVYLVARERGLERRSPTTVRALRLVERLACRLPDRLIIDTADYVAWLGATHGVPAARCRTVPTGADDRVFRPTGPASRPDAPGSAAPVGSDELCVLYYGTFIPNHGVEHVVAAARLLAAEPAIRFVLVGDGPERARAGELARGLGNVTFVDWLPRPELVALATRADVCLGAFGATPQSLMTVQNKVYEGLALAKPVVTGDSPAVRAELAPGEHVYLCQRESPRALADALLALRADPALRARLSRQGHRLFVERFGVEPIGRRFAAHLREVVGTS